MKQEVLKRVYKWDITNRCNMGCAHCLNADKRHGATDLSLEGIKKAIDKIAPYGSKISLLGGEPTCTRDFPEIIRYIRQKGIDVEIVTNGLAIGPLEGVIDNVNRVTVSIDGYDQKTYGALRPERFFERVVGNARKLAQNVPVDINCVVNKHNFDVLDHMIDLALEIGAKSLNFLQMLDIGSAQGKNFTITLYEVIKALTVLGERINRLDETDPSINPRFVYPLVVDCVNKRYGYHIPLPSHMCGAGVTFGYINQRGELFPCDRIADCWPVDDASSLVEHDFSEICTSQLFRRAFAFQVAEDTYDRWEPCNHCPYLRKTCFPCPVQPGGLVKKGCVESCATAEKLLEIEIPQEVMYNISLDKKRGVVFNPLKGTPLSLNVTAVEIFEGLQKHGSVPKVVKEMRERYSTDVREDVMQVVEELLKKGVVRYRDHSVG